LAQLIDRLVVKNVFFQTWS